MPITKSAQKALRQNIKRRGHNLAIKNRMKDAVKNFRKLCANRKYEEARSFLPVLYKIIDKTARRGTIKKNSAARKKSRLTKLFNKTFQQKTVPR